MKYVLLSALLALGGTKIVSSQLVEWCKGVDSVQIEEGRSYSRTIRIEQKDITVIYEDRGYNGRSGDDVLRIEGYRALFIDEKLDGILDSGEIEGVFFNKKVPPPDLTKGEDSPYLIKAQEAYSELINKITTKIYKTEEQGQRTKEQNIESKNR